MAQRIIIIHGRSTKPAKRATANLLRDALLQGLDRVDRAKGTTSKTRSKAERIRSGKIKIDYVYYGDINNAILAKADKTTKAKLTDKDPDCDNAPCLPVGQLPAALDALAAIKRFDKRAYRKVLKENTDFRFIDDAARAVSTLASILSASRFNEYVIKTGTADMGAYLMTRAVGSEIRERLQNPLKRALKRGDDVCLITHSMGCMVAYDVLWKFSRMSEYRDVRDNGNRVARWITLGCPLGEAGVKANLYDANERNYRGGTDKHPKGIIRRWVNFAAQDDFISHDASMKDDYRAMTRYKFIDSISDYRLYNCFAQEGRSNPHKFFGYLVHPGVANVVAEWMK
ncbi:MAG: hypothetical protein AAF871_15700 [Pseudomonadota bacterium]